MRGPDPTAPGYRTQSRMMPPELRKHPYCVAVGGPGPDLPWREVVGQAWVADGDPRTYSGRDEADADGAYDRSLSRIVTNA